MAKLKRIFKARCTICRHPDRQAIEMARVAGVSFEAIAAKFDRPGHRAKRDAIWRHCRDHLDEASRASFLADIPLQELAQRAAQEGVSLLDYFGLVRSVILQQMLVAAGANDGHRAAALAGRAVQVLREIGRLTGDLQGMAANLTINNNSTLVLNSPLFAALQSMLIERLSDFPAALSRVVEGLQELEAKSDASLPLSPPLIGGAHATAA